MLLRLLGYIFLGTALILAFSVFYRNSPQSEVPLIFTPSQLLAATWRNYSDRYVEKPTYRTIDTSRDNVTTSEGQSYTMLRAVWMDDKTTFDGAWNWTHESLQHATDTLFAWEWGEQPNGTYGVLTQSRGENSASDADTDIALALVFAYARWQDPNYLSAARSIIRDIWKHEVVEIKGVPYLAADDVEKNAGGTTIVVNPSYFNPAAYRIFATIDAADPWLSLVDSSYAVLTRASANLLDTDVSDGLPPDWILINRSTGALSATYTEQGQDSNFGYDAIRIPFMLALDSNWFGDSRDTNILSNFSFLMHAWQSNQSLASVYAHDGSIITSSEASSIYGGTIGYFMIADHADAASVYQKKLLFLYNPGANEWKIPLSYYDDNWAWFGIALYNNLLPNLTASLPAGAFKQ